MSYFLSFLSAFALSVILTAILRKIGIRFNLVSKPRERDIHKKPVPRIGGLAIFLSFFLTTLAVFFVIQPSLTFQPISERYDFHMYGILVGGALISLFMFVDDLRNLKAPVKLFIQILVALVVIASGIGIDTLTNPFGGNLDLNSVYIPLFQLNGIVYHFSLWSDLLTLIWLVGMMNVLNFIDGIDGLASGQSAIASLVIFLLSISAVVSQPATATLSIILAGSSLGFLVWNFPPAKIFMGDSGSMFLGFMLGVLPLISGGKLATAFLVLGFPIVDGVFVAISRLFRGKNPLTTPDKTHLHHRFLEAGFSQKEAIISLYLIALAFGWVALRSTTLNKILASIALVVLLLVLILVLNIFSNKKRKNSIIKA